VSVRTTEAKAKQPLTLHELRLHRLPFEKSIRDVRGNSSVAMDSMTSIES
jgi:hypothetical protein